MREKLAAITTKKKKDEEVSLAPSEVRGWRIAWGREASPRVWTRSRPPTRSVRLFGWFRRFAKLWGFALFCIFVVYVFRDVALPFVFAILVAYILAPLVDRMARLRVAGRPLPRGLAVIFLYINILLGLGLFVGYFLPKLSGDIARVFREAPELFQKLNGEVLPRVGSWIDDRFGAGVQPAQGPPQPAPRHRRATGWCSSRSATAGFASTSTI